jgi:hypothetical protein
LLNKISFGEEGNLTFSTNSGITSRLNGNNTTTTSSSRGRTGLIVAGVVLVVAAIGFFLIRNQLMAPDQKPTATIVATVVEEPTLTVVPITETSAPAFAPACSADVVVPVPEVRLTDNRCLGKNPYAVFAIPAGATFESLTANGKCQLETNNNQGRQVISCTGPDFLTIDLKVCLPPPPPPANALNQCSPDTSFNPENQCCMAVPPQDVGCVVQQVALKGCE